MRRMREYRRAAGIANPFRNGSDGGPHLLHVTDLSLAQETLEGLLLVTDLTGGHQELRKVWPTDIVVARQFAGAFQGAVDAFLFEPSGEVAARSSRTPR